MHLLLLLCFVSLNWILTAIGSSLVFFTKKQNDRLVSIALGCSAGIMIAASFFSLILPAMSLVHTKIGLLSLPAGFICGALFLRLLDKIMPHIHLVSHIQEGAKSSFKNNSLLFLAMTLHNIPEGIAVGIAFASSDFLLEAMVLSIGIGIQNIPEGTAISLPMHSLGYRKKTAFHYGHLSGLIEIPSALLGYIFAYYLKTCLPFALCFGAGAMIFICVEEIIPEASGLYRDESAVSAMIGFVIMMVLDIFLS